MPITASTNYVLTIASIMIDMSAVEARISLNGTINDQFVNQVQFTMPSTDFLSMILATPVSGKTRQEDLCDAIYNYAKSKGYAQGTVS